MSMARTGEGAGAKSKPQSQERLAITLKPAIRDLQGKISKFQIGEAGASPLLIATRKKRFARMQAELGRLS